MKILHISASDNGGAGIAAVRLHKAMLGNGFDSKMLCLRVTRTKDISIIKYSDSVIRKFLRASRLSFNHYIQNEKILKSKGGENELFSFINSDYYIQDHPLVREADIINLHYINGFIDYRTFFKNAKKPIFWTMHDMNPFQGGHHIYKDLLRINQLLEDVDLLLKQEKKRIYEGCQNLNIIALNDWVLNKSLNSDLFENKKHYVIPNTLNTLAFIPSDKIYWRNKYSLPHDKIILLFISTELDNFYKGGDLIREVTYKLKDQNVILCQVGKGGLTNKNIITLEYISDESALAGLYSAVDATIIASRGENLPNIMLESMSCGRPVISTPVGGCINIIRDFENGILAKEISAQALFEAIMLFVENKSLFKEKAIRNFALQTFSPDIIVRKYIDAYSDAK